MVEHFHSSEKKLLFSKGLTYKCNNKRLQSVTFVYYFIYFTVIIPVVMNIQKIL